VAQFGIVGFDGIGLAFTFRDFVAAPVIPQPVVSLESITEIMFGLGGLIDQGLAGCVRSQTTFQPKWQRVCRSTNVRM